MFDPILLLDMAATALILLTLDSDSESLPKKPRNLARQTPEIFKTIDGKTYLLHGGMWIEKEILDR